MDSSKAAMPGSIHRSTFRTTMSRSPMLFRKIRSRLKTAETGSSCPRRRSRVQWFMPTSKTGVISQARTVRAVMTMIPGSESMARTESGSAFMAAVFP